MIKNLKKKKKFQILSKKIKLFPYQDVLIYFIKINFLYNKINK